MLKARICLVPGPEVRVLGHCALELHSGLLEGVPTPEVTAWLRRDFIDGLRALWGERVTLEVPPTVVCGVWLPPIACATWLSCDEPRGLGEGDSGSELVVVWYQHSFEGLPVPPAGVMDRLEWSQQARNFSL